MNLTVCQPAENLWPGIGVYTEPPYFGAPENIRPRLQATADMLGATILTARQFDTNIPLIEPPADEDPTPDQFMHPGCNKAAAIVRSGIKNDFDIFIGWFDGDSGMAGMSMQLAGTIFDGMLLRNCVNHQREMVGRRRFTPYSYTAHLAQQIAVEATLPVRYVDIMHAFTGTPAEAQNFALRMDTLRVRATYFLKLKNPTANTAPLLASVEAWPYTDLLRPDYAKRQLEETTLFTTGI